MSKYMVIRLIEEIGSKKHNCICGYKVNGEIKAKEGAFMQKEYQNENDMKADYNAIKSTWTMLANVYAGEGKKISLNEDLCSVVTEVGNKSLIFDMELPNGLTYRRTCDFVNQEFDDEE